MVRGKGDGQGLSGNRYYKWKENEWRGGVVITRKTEYREDGDVPPPSVVGVYGIGTESTIAKRELRCDFGICGMQWAATQTINGDGGVEFKQKKDKEKKSGLYKGKLVKQSKEENKDEKKYDRMEGMEGQRRKGVLTTT